MWTDEPFHFVPAHPNDASNAGADPELPTQQSILQAAGLDGLFPTWCPEGFSPGAVKITELYDSISANMSYFGEDRNYSVTIIQYMQPQTSVGTFEKDDTPVEEYVYHDVTHYIFSNRDSTTVTWLMGDINYYMTVTDGALDIKALIRSIYEPQ